MNYWLVRGSPFENGSFPFVQPNARHQWRTKRPPRSWQVADRLLFWASSPRLELIALGLFEGQTGERTPDEEEIYNVRYLTAVVDSPLTLAELRIDPMLKNAIFLKNGPASSVVRLSEQEGAHLYRLLIARNLAIQGVWRDLESSDTSFADSNRAVVAISSTLTESVKNVLPSLSDGDLNVLQALLVAPNHAASAGELRLKLGLPAVVQVNAAIGRIGRKVYEDLGKHPEGLASGEYEWWHVVATGARSDASGFVWTLRDDVVAGLLACGWSVSGYASADEVVVSPLFFEGAVKHVTVNAYERNPQARRRCIEAHGVKCSACNLDFGTVYGALAMGFIHVHHTKPIASIGMRYEVDPVEDLRPVCPNCHAVIHMSDPPRTIKEVKDLLAK